MLKLSNTLIFTGDSYASGEGLTLGHDDPGLWCNILHQNHSELKNLNLINTAISGLTNLEIFKKSIELMVEHRPRFIFVAWSEAYRIKINCGVETYDTSIYMSPISSHKDVKLNSITYPSTYIDNIKHRFFDLQNIHYIYLEVLDQSRILKNLADLVGCRIFFVNTYFDWDDNYFDHITDPHRIPSQLTKFTQSLLNIHNRDDDEIFKIYDKLHSEYKQTQGLENWINLYQGFRSKYYLDLGTDDVHPGYDSHRKFAEFLMKQF